MHWGEAAKVCPSQCPNELLYFLIGLRVTLDSIRNSCDVFSMKLCSLYLRSFRSEKVAKNDDVSEQGLKDKSYHCQAPGLQSCHCWGKNHL